MSSEPGGISTLTGTRYERSVFVLHLLRAMENGSGIKSVSFQPRQGTQDAPDVGVNHADGTTTYISCKKENGNKTGWSAANLDAQGVLAEALRALKADRRCRFWFWSETPALVVRSLATQARNATDASVFTETRPKDQAAASDRIRSAWAKADPQNVPPEDAAVLAHLQRIEVECVAEHFIDQMSVTSARFLFDTADAEHVIAHLHRFSESKFRIERTAEDAFTYLAGHGIQPRAHIDRSLALKAIESRTRLYCDGLRPFLVNNRQIPRATTQTVVDAVCQPIAADPATTVWLTGGGGSGKSGVALAVVEKLIERGHPVLALRMDTHSLGTSPADFASIRDLPGTVGQTLRTASGGPAVPVLVLDQLDAIRWTTGHNGEALAALKDVVEEAVLSFPPGGVRVVAIARSFDLEENPGLKALRAAFPSVAVETPPLSENERKSFLGISDADWKALPSGVKKILETPQAMKLWFGLPDSRRQNPEGIRSIADLLGDYLTETQARADHQGVQIDVMAICREVAERMKQRGSLRTPRRTVTMSKTARLFLQSAGIIDETSEQELMFRHQTFADFLMAEAEFVRFERTGETLTAFFKQFPPSLFAAESTRLLLWLCRERDPFRFMADLSGLLTDEAIRFHARHTVMSFLREVPNPSSAEARLLDRLIEHQINQIDDPGSFAGHLLSTVLFRRTPWLKALFTSGSIESWLAGDHERLRRFAARELAHGLESGEATLADQCDRILRGAPDSAEREVADGLSLLPINEGSDALFDLRCRLVSQGLASSRMTRWSSVTARAPNRALRMLSADLDFSVRHLTGPDRNEPIGERGFDPHALAELSVAMTGLPSLESVQHFLGRADAYFTAQDPKGTPSNIETAGHKHWPLEYEAQRKCDGLERFTWTLLGRIARRRPKDFCDLLPTIDSTVMHRRTRRGLTVALRRLPKPYADRAVQWLIDAPELLHTLNTVNPDSHFTYPEDSARMALRHLGVRCSDEYFHALIDTILAVPTRQDTRVTLNVNQRKPDATGPNERFWSYVGITHHRLLSTLPMYRLEPRLQDQCGVWRRKFGRHEMPGPRPEAKAGFVGSAIPAKAARRFTDRQWRELMQNTAELARNPGSRSSGRRFGSFESSDPEYVATTFRQAAMDEPDRFVRLSEAFPDDLPEQIVRSVLAVASLEEEKDLKRYSHRLTDDMNDWTPATSEGVIPLVRRTVTHSPETYTRAEVCDVIGNRNDIAWPADVVDWLRNEACGDHGDKPWSVRLSDEGPSGHDIETSVINARQPRAILALIQFVYADTKQTHALSALQQAIESASVSVSLPVRTAAVQGCTAWLNINREQALSMFLTVTSDAEDLIWDTHQVGRFLSYTNCTEDDPIGKLLVELRDRPGEHARAVASSWMSAYWLFCNRFDETVRAGIDPTSAQAWSLESRKAAMETLAKAEGSGASEKNRIDGLIVGMEDPEPEVFDIAAQVVRQDLFWQMPSSDIDRFVCVYLQRLDTEGLREGRPHLLGTVSENHDRPARLADAWLSLVDGLIRQRRATNIRQADRDYWLYEAAGRALAPLVLRLISEATGDPSLTDRCLDAWDGLLSSGLLSTNELTKVLNGTSDAKAA